MLTIDQIADFDRDGFVLVEGMFSIDEVDILRKAVKSALRVQEHTIVAHDADDNESPLAIAIWKDIGEDVFGVVSASPRIVKSIRALLREESTTGIARSCLNTPKAAARGNGIKATATGMGTVAPIRDWLLP